MPAGEPQFATVSLLVGDAVEGTFRVPITDETTVRRLAKDAMRRLLTRSSAGKNIMAREKISVSEVFVKSGENKVEIFAQDLVTQVILIKEEVLYMRVHMREVGEAEVKENSSVVAPTATTTNINSNNDNNNNININNNCKDTTMAPVSTVQSPEKEVPKEYVSRDEDKSLNTDRVAIEETSFTTVPAPPNSSASNEEVRIEEEKIEETQKIEESEENAGVLVAEEEEEGEQEQRPKNRRLGWGPEAHKNFASNYVSSPNKLLCRRGLVRKPPPKKKTAPPPPVIVVSDSKKPPEKGPSPASVVEKEQKRGLGWGPEAGKYFSDNFVNSPDRLARICRRKKGLEEKKRKGEEEEERAKKAQQQEEKEEKEKARKNQTSRSSDVILSGTVRTSRSHINDNQHHSTPPYGNSNGMPRGNQSAKSDETEEPRTAPTAVAFTTSPHPAEGNVCPPSRGSTSNRKRRLSEVGESGSALRPIVVERQLNFEATDDADVNRKPGEQSTKQLINGVVEPETTRRELPPGWGRDAIRYFDVETYFDDPRKAKLSPEILLRPLRARRDAGPPPYFFSINK